MTIAIHETAPDFELPSHELDDGSPGRKVKLSALRGKPVVLAFYPMDFSPTCTKENTCFRDDLTQFAQLGAQVLGISIDSKWTHAAFAKSLGVSYPLLADFHPKGAVAKAYGLYQEDKGFSKRATVVIDKNGKVAWVKEHSGQRSNAEVLEAIRGAS
ncbi:MAG: redoxin domain-containing protein [Polyangiales bacterium]